LSLLDNITVMPSIRHVMKIEVWDRWIGESIGKILCLMCQKTPITQLKFVCAHVLAHAMGGETSVENLRPLCTWCNSSMGMQHMTAFALQNFPKSPLILTLPLLQSDTAINQRFNEDSQLTGQNLKPNSRLISVTSEIMAKGNLDPQIKQNRCKGIKAMKKQGPEIRLKNEQNLIKFNKMKRMIQEDVKVAQTRVIPNTSNPNAMYLGSKDNILDVLVAKKGIFRAIKMVKKATIEGLYGACAILQDEHLLEAERPLIMHPGKSLDTYVYYDGNNQRVVETSSVIMGQKLADFVRKTYVKGLHCLKKNIMGMEKTGEGQPYKKEMSKLRQVDLREFELDTYDIEYWMVSIHELSDERYQKKLLKGIKIPFEEDYIQTQIDNEI
jgi:hypothetical protein